MQVRRIPRNIPIHFRKFLYRYRISYPYISGDAFANCADYVFLENKSENLVDVASAKIIFCASHLAEKMIQIHFESINAHTLILGNSDRDFDSPLEFLPASIKKIYCQNLSQPFEGYSVLPIGIENLRLGNNGQTKLFSSSHIKSEKKDQVLIGPFSPTHPERKSLIEELPTADSQIHYINNRISPANYAALASNYKFVAAPRGNGLDTHRFWEALYRGSYPIVLKSKWSDSISDLGIPLVTIDSWNVEELAMVTKLRLPNFNPIEVPALWMPFWEKNF